MITRAMVLAAMQRWECAGLVAPAALQKAPQRLVEGFLERFAYMEEAELEYVTQRVLLGATWPKYGEIEQLAREFQEKHSKYVYIDYFKELRYKAFGEKESFNEFVVRIAEKYFPGRGDEWRKRYQFTLFYYGVCCNTCANCEGRCPYNGHRYHLRIRRGSACPVPWGSLELCDRFKTSIDSEGKVKSRAKSLAEKAKDKEEQVESMQVLTTELDFDLADLLTQDSRTKPTEKLVQLDIFAEEVG